MIKFITINNKPELKYVLEWCDNREKLIAPYMYMEQSFPYFLDVQGGVVGWTDRSDRAAEYITFRQFVGEVDREQETAKQTNDHAQFGGKG